MEGWIHLPQEQQEKSGWSYSLHSSGRAETQFGKWVLLPEVQREPLPQERAAVVLSAGQREQSVHFLCKHLREGGESFVLGLQMEPVCCSVQKKCPGLGAVGSDSSLFNGSCDGILCSGALWSALVPLTHPSHFSIFVTLPLWEAQAGISEQ